MWIKKGANFHQFISDSEPTSFCGLVRPKHAEAQGFVDHEKQCRICRGVWFIVCTSVDDARHTVERETNLRVLRIAMQKSNRKTLTEMIARRIRKVESEMIKAYHS